MKIQYRAMILILLAFLLLISTRLTPSAHAAGEVSVCDEAHLRDALAAAAE